MTPAVTSSNSIAALWASHSRRSMDWAKIAYGSFLNKIDLTLARQYLQRPDEITLIVFGNIQAAKTALCLELMGIASDFFGLAVQVLNTVHARDGGAEIIVKCGRSVDNHWRLVMDGQSAQYTSHQSIEDRIQAIRSEFSINGLRPIDPICLGFPGSFFTAEAKAGRPIHVIDLPEDGSNHPIDQVYVDLMAEKYIPNVDLVLLVGDIQDLNFIDPIHIRFPALSDWCYSPSRFRIITTQAPPIARIQDERAQHDLINQRALLQQILRDLVAAEEIIIPELALNLCLYYPLALNLKQSTLDSPGLEIQHLAQRLAAQLLLDLKRDIQHSASTRRRLRHAAQVHILANEHKRARQIEFEAQIRSISGDSIELEQKTHILKSAAAWTRLDAGRPPSVERVRNYQSCLRASTASLGNWANQDPTAIKSKISELQRLLHDCVDDLMRTAAYFDPADLVSLSLMNHLPTIDKIRDKWLEPQLLSLKQRLTAYFDPARQANALATTSLDGDLADLRRLSALGVEVLHVALRFNWESVINALDRDVNQQLKKSIKRLNTGNAGSAVKLTEPSSFPIYLESIRQQLKEYSNRLERDEATGRSFLTMLLDAFELQVSEIRTALAESSSATTKLVLLLALRQLDDEKILLLSPVKNFREINQ